MVHMHIITDSFGNITLCNKHLLTKRKTEIPTNGRVRDVLSTFKRANKYISTNLEKKIYLTYDERVPMETRMWVNQAFKMINLKHRSLQ